MNQTDPANTSNIGTTTNGQPDDAVDLGQDDSDMSHNEELPGAMINSADTDLNPNDEAATPDLDPDR